MNCSPVGNENGLLAYWTFEEYSQGWSDAWGGVPVSLDVSGSICEAPCCLDYCYGNGNNAGLYGPRGTHEFPFRRCCNLYTSDADY